MAPIDDKQMHVMMPPSELRAVKERAEKHGLTLSEYVRAVLLAAMAKDGDRPVREMRAIGLMMQADLSELELRRAQRKAEEARKAAGLERSHPAIPPDLYEPVPAGGLASLYAGPAPKKGR